MPSARARSQAWAGARTAEGEKRKVARIDTALDGDGAYRARHVDVDDLADAERGLLGRETEQGGDAAFDRGARGGNVERQRAPGQCGRQEAEHDIGIGYGRLVAAEPIAGRAGLAPAEVGPTASKPPESIPAIEPAPLPTSATSIVGTCIR
jgi:hypothetical protein